MDAVLLNKCEAEAQSAFLHIAERLGFDVVLEATTATEGGYRQIWKFVRNPKNLGVTTVLATALIGGGTIATSLLSALVTAAVSIWVAPPKPDPVLEALQAELLRKSIEEKSLEIKAKTLAYEQALEQRSKQSQQEPPPQPTQGGSPQQAEQKDATPPSLQTDAKVVTRRTNFYKLLLPYHRVTGIGYGWKANDSEPISEHKYIDRAQFIDFIRPVEEIEPRIINDAVVEIVAPVLRSSEMKWKGIFEGASIAFEMKDSDFKAGVLSKGVQFQSGDPIVCLLHVKYKINEVGERVVARYEAKAVYRFVHGDPQRKVTTIKVSKVALNAQIQMPLKLADNE